MGGSARKKHERNQVHAYMHQMRRRLSFSLCRALTPVNGSRSGASLPAGRRFPKVRSSNHPLRVELRRVNTPIFCGEVQGIEVHCGSCKKDYKVTWTNPSGKTGGPDTTMAIVDENGKPCMVYIKAS